ncbi:trace amine-associated receptor 13c-like [Erpetoichthys calabaricus]|uniref:trace amine-associated receptor 13c-like n=1 Tax=Erpetoichthys calabaricus TaxID=27687 RepID=UPI002234C1EE|nr:trace amine-associated receptor 13c-like [Erpetoichthys calabaricus]
MYVMLYVCSAASVMLTILGNILVVISVSHFRQLHTPSNLIVLSLAAADFLVGIFLMPLKTIQIIEGCWYFGDTFCYFHALFGFLLTSVSVSNMVFIAIDRYVAVCDPLLYGTKITIPLVQLSITTSWISSILYAWAILFFKGHYLSRDDGSACLGECVGLYTDAWGIVDLIVSFILPCTVIVCLYAKVFMVARRHSKVMNLANQHIFVKDADQNKIPKKSERKAAKTLGIVISVFLLFWVPFYLCAIINAYTDVVVSDAIINSFIWLAYLNSGMNPIIYALFYPWFQKSAKLIMSLKICSPESSIMNLFSVNH